MNRVKNSLATIRKQRNLNQADLAAGVKVSRQTINGIENGKTDPTLATAIRLARFLNHPIESIFELEDADPAMS